MRIKTPYSEVDARIISYFELGSSTYLLYQKGNNVCLGETRMQNNQIRLILPNAEEFAKLKVVFQVLTSQEPNVEELKEIGYHYIDSIDIIQKEIYEEEVKPISLSETSHQNMIKNPYLTYPYQNPILRKNKSRRGWISIAAIAFLVLFFGLLMLGDFHPKTFFQDLFRFTDVELFFLVYDTYITNYFLVRMSLLLLVLSTITYDSEETHPVRSYALFFCIFFFFSVIFSVKEGNLNFGRILEYKDYFKLIMVDSLIWSFFVTLPYFVTGEIIVWLRQHSVIPNFITHYAIFLVTFLPTMLGMMMFYNTYLAEPITKWLSSIL